ncbi:MAG TPA: hypothetical protein VGI40_15260 [Pirellulaceae bacterium]
MRYHLRTLLIVLALGPPLLAVAWLYGSIVEALFIWACILGAIPGLFALWYWMTCKSQAMEPRARGGEPTSYG